MNIKGRLQLFFSMPLISIFHSVRLRLSGKKYLLSGRCLACGKCCRNINLKYRKGWIRTERQFEELLEEHPEYSRFVVEKTSPGEYLQFNCTLYDIERGCTDYPNRLDICRRYPSTSLLMQGGKLLHDCGYTLSEGVPFQKYLRREMNRK